jgi:hypothetical protein
MKTIYSAVMARLKTKVKPLRWIDLDTGQLERAPVLKPELERQALAFPCALVGINIPRSENITDTEQDCEARVIVRLAFNQEMRTNAAAPASVAPAALKPYDIIADVYAALQGWGTPNFDPLSRVSQQKENSRNGLFIYRIEFKTEFEDQTASK